MSSFILSEDVEGEDHLDALMNSTSTGADAHRQTTTNDAADNLEAEAALDSILETSVAEVNLALSHDDAVTAAVNAAALDATIASSVVVDEAAVTAAAAVAATDPSEEMKVITEIQNSVPIVSTTNDATTVAMSNVSKPIPQRSGRWTLDEKILFLFGLQKFGRGHWKKISMYVPDRSLVQIKSHAQKVMKRIASGENVFCRLEENVSRLHVLVKQRHEQLHLEPPTVLLQPTTFLSYNMGEMSGTSGSTNGPATAAAPDRKKKAVEMKNDGDDDGAKKRPRSNKTMKNGTEHIAASALCQLADPEGEENPEEDPIATEDGTTIMGDIAIKTDDDIEIGELISI